MKNIKKLIFAFAGLAAGLLPVYAQTEEEEIEALLRRVVEVENPVYMPVVGAGIGYFNFYGNVNNAHRSSMVSQPGYRINVATFLGKQHYFRGNLTFMTGSLTGTQRTVNDTSVYKNLNFKSNIYSFGLNFHYSFKPWIKGKFFEPFISVGVETLQFDTKSDFLDAHGLRKYHYWPDGTIRGTSWDANLNIEDYDNYPIMSRDYYYDTDLRSLNQNGLGKYSQFAIAIPVDVGIDFNISERVTLRAATSLHYAFTDLIDDMSAKSKNDKIPEYKGKSKQNMYTFSYLSLHLDLFSSDKFTEVEDLFANIDDFDFTMFEDSDGDGVLDGVDQCPDTPPNVPVDSVGCPFDSDGDGVPDYLDRELNSRPGAIVDEYGVEINENMVIEILNTGAIRRSEVEAYLQLHRSQNRVRRGDQPIPDKFKPVDINGDGYISFDELIKVINDYFDGSSDFSPDDIKELNDFFFEQ
jgi:hypothetical protein